MFSCWGHCLVNLKNRSCSGCQLWSTSSGGNLHFGFHFSQRNILLGQVTWVLFQLSWFQKIRSSTIKRLGQSCSISHLLVRRVPVFMSVFLLIFCILLLRSCIGSVLIVVGLYVINWGQATSQKALEALSLDNQIVITSSGDLKVPLLG